MRSELVGPPPLLPLPCYCALDTDAEAAVLLAYCAPCLAHFHAYQLFSFLWSNDTL